MSTCLITLISSRRVFFTSSLEFQFFEYNANHELTGYTIQFVNNLVDRTVSRLTKEIVYENNLLTKQVSPAGIEQYYYTAGKLDSIRTTAVNGKWISTLFFQSAKSIDFRIGTN